MSSILKEPNLVAVNFPAPLSKVIRSSWKIVSGGRVDATYGLELPDELFALSVSV